MKNNFRNLAIFSSLAFPSLALAHGVGNHYCMIDDADQVKCWGRNDRRQTDVPELKHPKSVSVGEDHSCAIDDTGVVCWGATQQYWKASDIPNESEYIQGGDVRVDRTPQLISIGSHTTCGLFKQEYTIVKNHSKYIDSPAEFYLRCNGLTNDVSTVWKKRLSSPPAQLEQGIALMTIPSADWSVEFSCFHENNDCSPFNKVKAGDNSSRDLAFLLTNYYTGVYAPNNYDGPLPLALNGVAMPTFLNRKESPRAQSLGLAGGIGTYTKAENDAYPHIGVSTVALSFAASPNARIASIADGGTCVLNRGVVDCSNMVGFPLLDQPTQIDGGRNHFCALDKTGVHCWDRAFQPNPATLVPALKNPTEIFAFGDTSCARDNGRIKCWGSDQHGEVSNVPTSLSGKPTLAVPRFEIETLEQYLLLLAEGTTPTKSVFLKRLAQYISEKIPMDSSNDSTAFKSKASRTLIVGLVAPLVEGTDSAIFVERVHPHFTSSKQKAFAKLGIQGISEIDNTPATSLTTLKVLQFALEAAKSYADLARSQEITKIMPLLAQAQTELSPAAVQSLQAEIKLHNDWLDSLQASSRTSWIALTVRTATEWLR